jgi:hypothetical protein
MPQWNCKEFVHFRKSLLYTRSLVRISAVKTSIKNTQGLRNVITDLSPQVNEFNANLNRKITQRHKNTGCHDAMTTKRKV